MEKVEVNDLVLSSIHTDDVLYPWVEELWLSSFPRSERLDVPEQRQHIDYEDLMCCLLACDGQGGSVFPVGFLTYWDFTDFCYVEHFAVDSAKRNHGYGARLFQSFLRYVSKPVVLEVELPEDDLSRRRIAFYQRNGMMLWQDFAYEQPPYRVGEAPFPLLLMATPDLLAERDAQRVVGAIHRHVYGVE